MENENGSGWIIIGVAVVVAAVIAWRTVVVAQADAASATYSNIGSSIVSGFSKWVLGS